MKKKVISTVLCAAMVASMFAGCGNKAADNSSAADNVQQTTAQQRAQTVQQQQRQVMLQIMQKQLPVMQSQI